ncbi:MAG: hypothetical protein SVU88_02260 [Candidatus Nanohaloarchaea archaeon]|nr:hypothetical protein [Candidatus Nanohaloarchaea archaeon]
MRGFANARQLVGLDSNSDEEWFRRAFEDHKMPGVRKDGGAKTTVPLQNRITKEVRESDDRSLPLDPGHTRQVMAQMAGGDTETRDLVDSTDIDSATPIIFDPEILSTVLSAAPVLDEIPMEGQQGFKAKYNTITGRDSPLGFMTEGDASDLTDNTAKEVTFSQQTIDMQLWVDLVDVSDFTQEAASHYMNVEDTELGQRAAEFARRKAQQIFYGDNSQGENSGFLGDSDSYDGITTLLNSNNVIDKSGTSSGFIDDIKTEIAQMRQNENVSVDNLVAVTSHEFYDVLQDEVGLDVNRAFAESLDDNVAVGGNRLTIDNVPVIPSSNIQSYTDGSYSAGDLGDVFVFSTRAFRFRQLVPFSQIPLAKTGLSETTALFEFGALIDKSQGNHGRHLQAYNF